MILRLPQVILDVGVELDGFGPAVAEDGLTDVLFVVGWHGTVAAVVFVVALTVEMVDEMLLQRMSNALGHVVVYLCDTEGHADGGTTAIGTLDTRTGEIIPTDGWFDLNGRRLQGKPSVKGVYINNGKKVVIK